MSAPAPVSIRGLGSRLLTFGHMIRFSHSVFALPFALSGAILGGFHTGIFPRWFIWGWVIVAMVGARSAAMAFNRIVDAKIDAMNPRTRDRELPRKAISVTTAWVLTSVAAAVFVLAASQINQLAFLLSPVALAIIFFYSITKRFTWASHLFLGLALGVAPVGGWVAVTGTLTPSPFILALGVLLWVAGFDVFYALQDLDFDRGQGLHSLPARFGVGAAFFAARALHFLAVAALAFLGPVLGLSGWYLVGVGVIAVALFYEHRLVSPGDLSRLDKAFFDMNAVVSVVYLFSAAAGVWL